MSEPNIQPNDYKMTTRDPRVISDGIGISDEAFISFSEKAPNWFMLQVGEGINKGWMHVKVARIERNK